MKSNVCRLISTSLLIAAVASATAAEKFPRVQPGWVRAVAIVNEMDPEVTHAHVGKTIFGTFEHKFENDWNIPDFVNSTLSRKLGEHGIASRTVELTAAERDLFFGGRCLSKWSGKFRPECAAPIKTMLDKLKVDAIAVIQPASGSAEGFSEQAVVWNYGVYTAGLGDSKDATIYDYDTLRIYGSDPPTMLDSRSCSTGEQTEHDFGKPIGQATLSDIDWIKPLLENLLEKKVDDRLKASGLIPGEPTTCP